MQEAAREALVAFVATAYAAAYPASPAVFDNDPFDWNSPPETFVEVEIKFYDGAQVNISADPKTRLRGFVYVTAYARQGTGSKLALQILDWFNARLKYAVVDPVQLQEPRPDGSDDGRKTGYYTESLKVEFHTRPA